MLSPTNLITTSFLLFISIPTLAALPTGPHFQGTVDVIQEPTVVFHGTNTPKPVRMYWQKGPFTFWCRARTNGYMVIFLHTPNQPKKTPRFKIRNKKKAGSSRNICKDAYTLHHNSTNFFLYFFNPPWWNMWCCSTLALINGLASRNMFGRQMAPPFLLVTGASTSCLERDKKLYSHCLRYLVCLALWSLEGITE